jgi:hypothetical protein
MASAIIVVAVGFPELVLAVGATGIGAALTALAGRSTPAVIACPGTVALPVELGVLVRFEA